MKITNIIIYLAIAIGLSSCARGCASYNRSFQTGSRHYIVTQYSGGKVIATYEFNGIINNQEHSDGYYWYQGDTLVEVSGATSLKSWK